MVLSNAPVIGQPWNVRLSGGKLWVIDAAGDPEIHVLDPLTGELLRSGGRKGGGPGEIRGALSNVQADPTGEAAIWAFDEGAQRMLRFAFAEPAGADSAIRLQGTPPLFRAAWLTSEEGVGVTGNPAARFVFFGGDGRFLRAVPGDLLGPETAPRDERVRATVTRFSLCGRPNSRQYAIAYGDAGRIEIHHATESGPVLAAVPEPAEPVFERRRRGTNRESRFRRTVLHYLGCASSADQLVALYSGVDVTAGMETANHGSSVHVFDWGGNLSAILHIMPAVAGIEVSEDGRTMYGVSYTDASVYRYAIPVGK
ncbi:MAG: hypothetical protein PVH00_12525 [Gemmatimonadota bacterium]